MNTNSSDSTPYFPNRRPDEQLINARRFLALRRVHLNQPSAFHRHLPDS